MKKFLLAVLLATIGSGGHASTVQSVDLSLRVDAFGYRIVEIEDLNDGSTRTFPFLSFADAARFGFSAPIQSVQFPIGQIISFSATSPSSPSEQLGDCQFGTISCAGAF